MTAFPALPIAAHLFTLLWDGSQSLSLITREGTLTMAASPKRKPTTRRKPSPKTAKPSPSEAEIRQRAYELYERRGGAPGHEQEDWARAERELRGEE